MMIHGVREFAEKTAVVVAPRSQSFGAIITDHHKSACRMLGYSLTANTADGWQDCARLWALRLDQGPLGGLAFAALRALDPEHRQTAFDLAHWGETEGMGTPLPPWVNVMEDARWWASGASRRERKAYALASFEAMNPQDRAAFLEHVTKGHA